MKQIATIAVLSATLASSAALANIHDYVTFTNYITISAITLTRISQKCVSASPKSLSVNSYGSQNDSITKEFSFKENDGSGDCAAGVAAPRKIAKTSG